MSADPDVQRLLATAKLYRLSEERAQAILAEVRAGLSQWPALAQAQGLDAAEIARMRTTIQSS